MNSKRVKYILLLLLLIFILLCKAVFFEFYRITSGSMMDTLLPGDFIIINKLVYGAHTPNIISIPFLDYQIVIPSLLLPATGEIGQNDVVIIKGVYPVFENNFVKRVVALEGQTIFSFNNIFFVDNIAVDDRSPDIEPDFDSSQYGIPEDFGPFVVPEGKIFVMGDNKNASYDSRHFGFVDKKDVIGKVWLIYSSIGMDGSSRWGRIFSKVE